MANDGLDDTAAIQRAVTDDENGVISCVWIPAGQWRQEQKILSPDPTRGQYNQKGIRNVVVRGAGMWHTQLSTNTQPQNVVGNINHPHEGNVGFDIDENTQISDLAIFGMTTEPGQPRPRHQRSARQQHADQQRVDRARQRRRLGRPRLLGHAGLLEPGQQPRVHRHAHPQHVRRRHQLLQRHAQLAGVQLVVPHQR